MRLAPALAILLSASCSRKEALPVYSTVQPFTLTDQSGQPFDSKALTGKIWVADFFFTHCPGPCPRMTSLMQRVQNRTEGTPQLHLVSLSVDPDRDTPAAMKEFAQRFNADFSRWHFLTGPIETLHQIGQKQFLLNSVDRSLQHSTRFALVDGKGQIRGFYASEQSGDIDQLLADIKTLQRGE